MNVSKEIKNITILGFFIAVIWISIEIIGIFKNTTLPKEYEDFSKPIDPTIDVEFLKSLDSRLSY